MLASSCLPACKTTAPTGRIIMKFGIWILFENLLRKFKFHWNLTCKTGGLHEDQYTFLIISHSILLIIRNVSDKICRENQNTHFVFNKLPLPPPKSWCFYETKWKNIQGESWKPQTITWRMRIECWIPGCNQNVSSHGNSVNANAFENYVLPSYFASLVIIL